MTSSAGFQADDTRVRRMTLEELVRAKRPQPVRSMDELMGQDVFESDDEVDEFVASVREWRQADLA
jgi:hypothetical protein